MDYKSFCAELPLISRVSEMPLHSDLRLRRFLAKLGNGLHSVAFLNPCYPDLVYGCSSGYACLHIYTFYTILFTYYRLDSNY